MEDRRKNFEERLNELDEVTLAYYTQIQEHLLSYKGIKSRLSIRCDSYRLGRQLLAKMAIGGKTLKVYLPIDIKKEEYAAVKVRFRDMSNTSAYEETPAMVPVKSELGVKKVCEVIDIMMKAEGVAKKA